MAAENTLGNQAKLLADLFDSKTVKVLQNLMSKQDHFYLRDISRDTTVSLATTYRIVQRLLKLGLVEKEQKYKFTVYKINRQTPIFEEIHKLVIGKALEPIAMFKELLAERFGSSFSMFATKGKDKKLFLVSEIIKSAEAKELAGKVKQETQTKLNLMVLQPDQFEQMKQMGMVKDVAGV